MPARRSRARRARRARQAAAPGACPAAAPRSGAGTPTPPTAAATPRAAPPRGAAGREVARDLQQRERVALPALDDPLHHRRRQLAAEPRESRARASAGSSGPEPELLGVGQAVVGFGGDQQRDPVDPQAPRDERDRLGRRLVEQVRVVDDDQDRGLLRRRGEEVEHAGVDRVAIRPRAAARPGRARTRAPPPARRAGARAGRAAARTAPQAPRSAARPRRSAPRVRSDRETARLSPRRRRAAPSFPLPPRRGPRSPRCRPGAPRSARADPGPLAVAPDQLRAPARPLAARTVRTARAVPARLPSASAFSSQRPKSCRAVSRRRGTNAP